MSPEILRAAGARAAIWSGLVQVEEADPEFRSGSGRGRAVITPDRRFLEPAKGSPRLVEPLGMAGADRLRLAEGGYEIVGAGLTLAVEKSAPAGLFHGLLDLGIGVAPRRQPPAQRFINAPDNR